MIKGEEIGIVKGEQIGMIKGEEIGIVKGKKESEQIVRKVAKNLNDSGMPIEKISELTGLSEVEINQL
jgi:predicted transposase/invertase (TIGR01784 family)